MFFSSEPILTKKKRYSSHKKDNFVMNYSPSCCSKPVKHSFIFGTLIEIFLMKSESFLSLHRQQGNYHGQGTETQ